MRLPILSLALLLVACSDLETDAYIHLDAEHGTTKVAACVVGPDTSYFSCDDDGGLTVAAGGRSMPLVEHLLAALLFDDWRFADVDLDAAGTVFAINGSNGAVATATLPE